MTKLQIGLVGYNPGWEILLQQIGISFKVLTNADDLQQNSVIIVTEKASNTMRELIIEYLEKGGVVLCTHTTFENLTGKSNRKKFIKYILPQQGSYFVNVGFLDIYSKCEISNSSNEMSTGEVDACVYFGEFSGGYLIALPFDAGEIVLDKRSEIKSFYSSTKRFPFECVSTISKGAVRRLVTKSIELLHHLRGLPFVHRWYFPKDARSVFALRIDSDGAARSEIKLLSDKLSSVTSTWFLDIKSQQNHLNDYLSMTKDEIGIHCYNHKLYAKYSDIINDIKKAKDVLQQYIKNICGYTAPFGRWNDNLGKAVEEFGFKYSSEFSYDYDNIPSYPYIGSRFSKVLQMPVHPITIGNLRRLGFNEIEMKEYFRYVIKEKLSLSEALFFYHHPKNHCESVLEDLIHKIQEENIISYNFIDYANWWEKRNNIADEISINDKDIIIKTEQVSEDIWYHLTNQHGEEVKIPFQSTINLDKLEWQGKAEDYSLPIDINRIRKLNPWITIIRIEDFFTKLLK